MSLSSFTRFAAAGIWLRQESLRHILASLYGYSPGTIAVNVTWMDWKENSMLVKRIAALYPSIFNRFPSNATRNFKSSQFLHILASPGYVSRTIAVNVTWIEIWKRIQCLSNASHLQHVPIYLQPFTSYSYSEILVGNCNFFLPLAFNAPVGKKVGPHKSRIIGLPAYQAVKTAWR